MEEEYWNNIMVGDTQSNDSQQFFERRREAMQKIKTQPQFLNVPSKTRPGQQTMSSKELMRLLEPAHNKQRQLAKAPADGDADGNKENESEKLLRMVEKRIGACTIKQAEPSKPSSSSSQASASSDARPPPSQTTKPATTQRAATTTRSADTSPRTFKVPAMKRTASAATVRPLSASAPSSSVAVVPNAYRYKAIYEQKLQRKTERMLEEERNARRVVARPMPNFEQAHRQLEQKQSKKLPTCPNTPKTLKYSLQSAERMKQRQEEYLRQKYAIAIPKARPAEVLVRAPYKPHIEPRKIEPEPFQMVGHERIEEIREIRERRNAENEQRRQQQLLEDEERERQLRLEQRKNTVFKARPNPFS